VCREEGRGKGEKERKSNVEKMRNDDENEPVLLIAKSPLVKVPLSLLVRLRWKRWKRGLMRTKSHQMRFSPFMTYHQETLGWER
jgi:hypothetical protein